MDFSTQKGSKEEEQLTFVPEDIPVRMIMDEIRERCGEV